MVEKFVKTRYRSCRRFISRIVVRPFMSPKTKGETPSFINVLTVIDQTVNVVGPVLLQK